MYTSRAKFKIFAEMELQQYIENNGRKIVSRIGQESEDYILNVNETDFVNYLVNEFTIDVLNVDFQSASVSSEEKQIPAEHFPGEFFVLPGKSYTKQIAIYHLPFSGDEKLLRCMPSSRIMWTTEIFVEDQCLCFEVISLREDAEEIKQKANSTTNKIKQQFDCLYSEISSYNAQLPKQIDNIFRSRKQRFLEKNKMLASLDVPIKKGTDLPETFTIKPPQIRKKITIGPEVTAVGRELDPRLDQLTYEEILHRIQDVGKEFERHPSTYQDKDEENLRDFILLSLQPQFEGSATGETFNKSGKTDVLLRYENSNVFIAECQFWYGQQDYLNKITQLLGYLTWRDSKAAVVVFVRNKDFSSVLKTVEEVTPNHSNYLGFVNKKDESWFNYRFHIKDDPNREVKLAVLLFHIPS